MKEKEIKKGRIKPEDWPSDLYWGSGIYRQRDGKDRLDPQRQSYPGQPAPPEDAPDEIESTGKGRFILLNLSLKYCNLSEYFCSTIFE